MITISKLLSKQYKQNQNYLISSKSKFSINSFQNNKYYHNFTTDNIIINTSTETSKESPNQLIDNYNNDSNITDSLNINNNDNKEEKPKTKKIKIKIKSKDPYLLLSNNKKIYFKKPTNVIKKTIEHIPSLFIMGEQMPFQQHPQIVDSPLIDTDFQINNYNYGQDTFNNNIIFGSHQIIEQMNFENIINQTSPPSSSLPPKITNVNNNNNNNSNSNNNNKNSIDNIENIVNSNNINSNNNSSNNNNNNSSNSNNVSTASTTSATETTNKKGEIRKKHIVLIDGTLMAYKANATTPPLTCGDIKVNVLYGFLRSLLKVVSDLQPIDSIVVCFDPKGGSNFRRELYPEYKSNRPPTPPDLIEQLKMIPEITESLNISFTKIDGYECDDLLATYAKLSVQEGLKFSESEDFDSNDEDNKKFNGSRVTIVTDDKDIFQLVNDNVSVYSTRKGLFNKQDVIDKFGFEPNKFVTFQSLIGDKVDNIPGIPRLGEKNATDIVKKFGTLNSILENIDQLPQKFIEPIRNSIDQLKTSYQLAKLNDNVSLNLTLDDIKYKPIDRTKFYNLLEKYNFTSIKESVGRSIPNKLFSDYNVVNENKSTKPSTSTSISSTIATRDYSKVEFDYIDDENIKFDEMSNEEINRLEPKNVTMVRDVETAKKVVQVLMTQKDRYHACDTEVIDIDLKKVSPIGHGKMICFSIYCGPQARFHDGNSRVWVDVMDDIQGNEILQVFKEYFEDESILKVWHNYAFDRHIFYNHGINVKGFGGDTLHMARLWNASRMNSGGYSLEALSKELLDKPKIPIKDLFGSRKIKANGEEGKSIVIPPLERIQRDSKYILNWIEYSSLDSELTWLLRENIHMKLREMEWNQGTNMWDFYYLMWRPFGHLLTEMEQRGLKVDIDYLKSLESKAYTDMEDNRKIFLDWAKTLSPGAEFMNPDSDAQIQQLFFAPVENKKTKELLPLEKDFECDNLDGSIEQGKTKARKKKTFYLKGIGMESKSLTTSGWPSVDSSSLRELAGKSPENGKFGSAYDFFVKSNNECYKLLSIEEREKMGKDASIAINSLLELGSIGTLLNTFIIPLQKLADSNSRLHTSVNVNTETGRLSSKKPNLQNQPALEKDRYKIRKAFTCEPGNVLIVADYGQLELRLLAHITNCKSMITAFQVGGDFHSRTAMGMYPHVKEAIDKGEVLLEWDGEGEPPTPLLKNVYASERRKAKTLNFSIAYGKTAHGLSQDWGVSLNEAKETLNRWYEDRPEVLVWQRKTIETAHKYGWTRTLMGRYRQLPDIANNAKGMRGHAERASINTPLQGGAADIVMKAMLIIEDNKRLKELGFKLIMQIHDELILEGPEQHADEARSIMMNLMSNPLTTPLLIDLVVDCRYAKTWYDAK
ncbi:hypothetical protein RB653_007550 [Dictyostelium firmibasis]|uniref:DNA-directed DNA polymerase n=1 Tax=Dictyostelium firmibasis TaxID=79012 RepID=A0AAN7TM06_9MYCE